MAKTKNRLTKLTPLLKQQPVLLMSWLDTNPNARYFTGRADEPLAVLATKNETIAYGEGPFDFADQTVPARKLREHFWKYLQKHRIKRLGMDESDGPLFARLVQKKVTPVPLHAAFQKIRAIKDASELAAIRRAQAITKKAVFDVANGRVGKTEHRVAGEIELAARKQGAALNAFTPIVASGPHGAQPHAHVSSRVMTKADPVVIDVGAKWQNYCGDFTHTAYDGSNHLIQDAVLAVKESYNAARKIAKVGVSGKKLNHVAQTVIKEYGFEKHSFAAVGLRLGHSVGLEVHDGFGLEDVTLKKGMAVTIEPGIYVPKKFGVRFEDIVTL
ncbi:MAG: M24 family metallopeptidase [Candidatus Micrarchaeota archaeon]|nr:M24 family metallopeptidase [Candidatus Micrarchaeota archaeon]